MITIEQIEIIRKALSTEETHKEFAKNDLEAREVLNKLEKEASNTEIIGSVTNWAFNLNQNIRVKLLDKGYQRLADLHNEFIGIIPNWEKRDAEYYKKQADQDGYTSFQAWMFMEYFGEVTRIGMHGYYSTEILISAKDITPCL